MLSVQAIDILTDVSSYMNPRTESQYEIIAGIHRALVEVYTLKQEGLALVMDYFAYDLNNEYALRLAEGAKFESDGQGGTRVAVEDEELRQDILESVKLNEDTMEEIIQQEELQAEEYTEEEEPSSREADSMPLQESASPTIEDDDLENEISEDEEFSDDTSESVHDHTFGGKYPIKPADDSWRDIAFEDLQIKFAVSRVIRSEPALTNTIAGPQASYAADRHAYSGP